MRGMRVRNECAACRYYVIEGICERCTYPDNLGKNWLGVVYHEHPLGKNINGRCKHYEEETIESGPSGSDGAGDGVRTRI